MLEAETLILPGVAKKYPYPNGWGADMRVVVALAKQAGLSENPDVTIAKSEIADSHYTVMFFRPDLYTLSGCGLSVDIEKNDPEIAVDMLFKGSRKLVPTGKFLLRRNPETVSPEHVRAMEEEIRRTYPDNSLVGRIEQFAKWIETPVEMTPEYAQILAESIQRNSHHIF